jgi:hypothetical protein
VLFFTCAKPAKGGGGQDRFRLACPITSASICVNGKLRIRCLPRFILKLLDFRHSLEPSQDFGPVSKAGFTPGKATTPNYTGKREKERFRVWPDDSMVDEFLSNCLNQSTLNHIGKLKSTASPTVLHGPFVIANRFGVDFEGHTVTA